MAYDELTTERFRAALDEALEERQIIEEKKMMGGVCFMLNGNMIGGADREKSSGQRRFMFRMGKENQAAGEALPGAIPMVMGKRAMRGFFFVDEETCDEDALHLWIKTTIEFENKLPPKPDEK